MASPFDHVFGDARLRDLDAAHKPETTAATLPTALVLGGTGRTGALVARGLAERGLQARTASRSGADVKFDWDDVTTYGPALAGADRVYLVTPDTTCAGVRLRRRAPLSHRLEL